MPLTNLSVAELRELRRMTGLGPYLGVFYGMPSPGLPRFGHGGDLFRLLTRLAPGRGLFTYVFTPESLLPPPPGLPRAPEVAGWFHDGREWVRALFPWPDVLYDRSITDTEEDNRVLAWARSQFPPHLPALNSWPLVLAVEDKWLTHQLFGSIPEAHAYLPALSLHRGVAGVRDMLDRYGAVVLKERYGHKARRVAFVRRGVDGGGGEGGLPAATAARSEGLFEYTRDVGGRQERGSGLSWPELADVLEAHTARGEFLVQQAIDRARFRGRYVELRAVMHKVVEPLPSCSGRPLRGSLPAGGSQWLRTGMVCRLTDPDLPFLALGREVDERPSRVLPRVFGGERAEALLEEVRSLAHLVKVLEERTGPGAELAMDFLVDRWAHPWLLEVNTRPAMLLKATASEHLRRRGVLRLLEYARYLVERSLAQSAAPDEV